MADRNGLIESAVVVGIGDGSRTRSLAHCRRLYTIGFPGENPNQLPGRVVMVSEVAHAGECVEKTLNDHAAVVDMPVTTFFDNHPIAPENEVLRKAFCREYYMLLARKPFDLGDDVIDGLQGAAHLAENAKYLLPAPMPCELKKLDCPAIAIASGPSLSRHVDTIRKLQDRCLIVSCDSALDGLMQHGITPHIVTPFERVEEVKHESFTQLAYPGVIFCGNPVVHQAIAPLFDRHIYMPGSDLLYAWGEAPPDRLNWFGQSTGTMAVCVAMNLTTGPIYLVGHDLAFSGDKSHWKFVGDGVLIGKDTIDKGALFSVKGYSGPVETQYWWDVFRREIEGFAKVHGNIINTNAPDGVGAIIGNTISGSLPHPEELPLIALPEFPAPNHDRPERFRCKVKSLPGEAHSLLVKLSSANLCAEDMDLRKLCTGPNRILFSYILRSILGQFSLELRKRPERLIVSAMAEAMRNSIRGCMGIFERMAACV